MEYITLKSSIANAIKHVCSTPALLVLNLEIFLGLCASSFSIFIFWEMSETVLAKERFIFDNAISMFFYQMRNPLLTSIMQFFSFIGMDGILLFSVLIPIFLYWKKRRHEAALFTIMISMGAIVNTLPEDYYQATSSDI